jgi:tetratricopeptide (TPR) repeat protein
MQVSERGWLAAAAVLCAAAPAAAAEGENDFLLFKDGRVVAEHAVLRAEGGLELVFDNGKVFVPQELVQDFYIGGEILVPESEEERAQAAKGNVRFDGRWMSRSQRDALVKKRVEERKQYFQAIAERSKWRNRVKVETKHFAFEHTLPDAVFERYRDLMEGYFEVFVREWKIKLPKDYEPLKVCIYSCFDEMEQTGGAGGSALGYFRFVRPLELNFFHERLDPVFSEQVMFHEAGHYLHKLMDMRFDMPHFPGEALAEYYGASTLDPQTGKFKTGLVLEGRLCEVKDDVAKGEWMGLQRLVSTDAMYEHYTWGWSLAHFLMSTPANAKKFQKFVMALPFDKEVKRTYYQNLSDQLCKVQDGEVWRAFQRFLDLDDEAAVTALEKQWHEYVRGLDVVTCRGYESAGEKAATGYPPRPIKAKRLFQTAIDMGSRNPMTFHMYAKILDDERETRPKAIEMWREALKLDPLNGEFYGYLGNAMIASGNKEEGERLKKLGVEIDPDARWITLDELGLEELEAPGK